MPRVAMPRINMLFIIIALLAQSSNSLKKTPTKAQQDDRLRPLDGHVLHLQERAVLGLRVVPSAVGQAVPGGLGRAAR